MTFKPSALFDTDMSNEETEWLVYGGLLCVLLFLFLVVAGYKCQQKHAKQEEEEYAARLKKMGSIKASQLKSTESSTKSSMSKTRLVEDEEDKVFHVINEEKDMIDF